MNCIVDFRTLMYNMEVLAASLTHDSRVSLVLIQICSNVLPKLLEYMGRSSKVKTCERRVRDSLSDNFRWGSWDKLDDSRGDAGLCEYLVNDVVRVSGSRRRLPDYDIADQCGCCDSIKMSWSSYDSNTCHLLPGRLPPIAVKLNGDTASTKPSSARYSTRLLRFGKEHT